MASASKSLQHSPWIRVGLCAALMLAWLLAAAPGARAQVDPRFDVLVFSRTVPAQSPHEAAIAAGHAAIAEMAAAGNFVVTSTEDATLFNDADLGRYEVVVFLNTDGNGVLNAEQRNAFERWMLRGNGLVAIHSATNADRDWAWWGDMNGGAWFMNHPSGAVQFQDADVQVEDRTHPATAHLAPVWTREDEWYSFTENPRGDVHVLMTLDEDSYDLTGATPMGEDHPIAWCSNYDRGRHFYTALGHHGVHWQEPDFRRHILGAIEWAAGEAQGDCGPEREGLPTDASFDKVTLDDNTENPMELAVAPDGRVFYVELAGRVKLYDPADNTVRVVGNIPVHRGNENGLLGITLDPDFETNNWLYLFYSAPPQQGPTGFQHVSRFTVAENGDLIMNSEVVLLEIFHQRLICCHSAGSMTFGPGGELYISTGDDTTPFETSSFAPLDDDVLRTNVPGDPDNDANRAYDARRTSGNTNDLRGKILRIVPRDNPTGEPGPGNTYDIPAGNLFAPGTPNTRPEIYTMGHRNPFRISVDQQTGWLYNGEVGPDAGTEDVNRGPRGYDEINQIREAGNMGWPFCIADNWRSADSDDSFAYRDWTYPSGPAGDMFDCSGNPGGGPVNTSAYNTGLTQLPPARPALLYWPYTPYQNDFPFPEIPGGSGRTAIAGPVYHFDPDNPADAKFPAYYDGKLFFADWSRKWIATLEMDENGMPVDVEEFMPLSFFRSPHDMEMGPDGSLYLIEWGVDFNFAGQGINPDSGLYRIDYVKGARSPVARASADRKSGPTPLEVSFSSDGSDDPDGDELTYEWNFGDGTPVSSEANPTHAFTDPGQYTVRLTVTDATGRTGTSSVVITAGNTAPTVELEIPEQGGFYGWGDEIEFRVNVTDPEDGTIDCEDVQIIPGIFHDEGGNAHVHEGVRQNGCEGTFQTPADPGHEKSALIALVVTAVYEDQGGSGGAAPPLIGADTHRLNPNQIQAEHFTGQSGGVTVVNRAGAEGGRRTASSDPGDWIRFDPVSLKAIDELTIRYTADGAGGRVELRLGAPDGALVGTADLAPTGSAPREATAAIDAPDDAQRRLYLVYAERSGGPASDMFELDELEFRNTILDPLNAARRQVDLLQTEIDRLTENGSLTAEQSDRLAAAESEVDADVSAAIEAYQAGDQSALRTRINKALTTARNTKRWIEEQRAQGALADDDAQALLAPLDQAIAALSQASGSAFGVSAELTAGALQVVAGELTGFTATVTNTGDSRATRLNVALDAPEGWEVRPQGPTSRSVLAPGQTFTVRYEAQVPVDHQPGDQSITGRATYRSAAGASVDLAVETAVEVVAPVEVTALAAPSPVLGGEANDVTVSVRNNRSSQAIEVSAMVEGPSGWESGSATRTIAPGNTAQIAVPVTPPLEPAAGRVALVSLRARVTAQDVPVYGEATAQTWAAPSGNLAALALDAGTATSPVQPTYRRLAPGDAWNPAAGYGWVDTQADNRDRGGPDLLRRDFTWSGVGRAPGTLRIAVPPGRHGVYALTGDACCQSSDTVVFVDGARVADTGELLPAGQFKWLSFELDGGSEGRTVDLVLRGEDYEEYWRLNALVVLP